MNNKRLLLGILIIAAFLRLWKIDQVPVSLFGDELDVGYHAYSILKTGKDYSGNPWPLHFQSLAEYRTPLFLYSVVPSVAIFGISPLGVRLPAAIFGLLGILALYFLVKELTGKQSIALVSAAILTFSPWHIQYSRAAFEVTQLLFFLLVGLYFFFKSLAAGKQGKWLWVSTVCFALTPWIYSTAKFFTPLLLLFLVVVYRKEIFKLSRKQLIWSIIALVVVAGPMLYSTLFGGGAQRFGYISVFTNPSVEHEVGVARLNDALMRGETGMGLSPTFFDRVFHNKFVFWGTNILRNYLESFSTDFLFIKGDLNLRHSIEGMGQFYAVEAIVLVLGLALFLFKFKDCRIKAVIFFWILAGVIPAALTRDGGKHATRLILILPPLGFLIAYGLVESFKALKGVWRIILTGSYLVLFVVNFIFYQHNFWIHNPWYSERWWHFGYKEAIQSIKEIENDYEKVIINTVHEPPWVFFAALYPYPPSKWHEHIPTDNWIDFEGYGRVTSIDKYYFGNPDAGDIYSWGKIIDNKTLYLASEKQVKINLITEPERTPGDLKLIRSIAYPSGQPAFYLFTGK